MRGFVARTLITAFGLWIADLLLGGLSFADERALFTAALLLGLANAFIRPVLILITLPLTLLSLGLFLFVINGAMLLLVAEVMESFHLVGLGTGIVASIIVGLTGWGANAFIGNTGRFEVWTGGHR